MVTSSSSTASGDINYLSDIGIQITRSGTLALDTEVLADALSNSFSDVVTALSADTNDDSEIGEASRGIAGDASKAITDFLASDGTINEITTQAQNASNDYTLALAELEARMEGVYERYINQFSAMESLVDQMNSTRDFLKTTLDNLPFTNKDN
jgi:flagellar hook-associated protein 2